MRRFSFSFLLLLTLFALTGRAGAQGYFGAGFGPLTFKTGRAHAPGKYDPRIDPALLKAVRIAEQRAQPRSTWHCWQYVKDALVSSGAVSSRPYTTYACQAGIELIGLYGFVQLKINDPYQAPIGSVLVYGDYGAGHVELRTASGFVSDYCTTYRCKYRLIGVFAKLTS